MSFINKVVIITGAASGIGEGIALHFAELSAGLSLIDIDTEKLRKVAEQCATMTKSKVFDSVVDIANDEELKRAVDGTVEKFGRIDVVINCAGIVNEVGILDSNMMNVFDRIMGVNLRSMVAMLHFAAPALIESKGCVVNIASVMANMVNKRGMPYNVSKAAVCHFTKNAALELADAGVRVNSVSPGAVRTSILLNMGKTLEENDAIWNEMKKISPLQRNVKSNEIAEMVSYLASDRAQSITGADFVVDSGLMLSGL